jgi:hypothetical protein
VVSAVVTERENGAASTELETKSSLVCLDQVWRSRILHFRKADHGHASDRRTGDSQAAGLTAHRCRRRREQLDADSQATGLTGDRGRCRRGPLMATARSPV